MHRIHVIAAALCVALSASCGSTPRATSSPAAVAGPNTLTDGRYTLVVHGMSCPKCISNVELQLTRISGITHPIVDMKNGFVRVEVAGGSAPTKDAIANAIADSGFTLVEIRGGVE